MATPTQIKSSIISFLFFKIDFDAELKSFVFKNRTPLKEIDDSYFEKDITMILKNIGNHLVNGKENLVFLKDLIEIIDNKSKHFEKYEINTASDVDDYFISIDQIRNTKDIFFVFDSDKEEHTEEKQEFNFGEENKSEFIRVFKQAKYYAYLLYCFVDGLIIDFETIDFKEFDFDQYIKSHNIQLANDFSSQDNSKCIVNYNKIDVANLFHILLEESIFYFSDDERKNKVLLQKFIEGNFLYKGKEEKVSEIKAINKEFSKVGYNGEELQLNFLKSFRNIIDLRIDKIENKKTR